MSAVRETEKLGPFGYHLGSTWALLGNSWVPFGKSCQRVRGGVSTDLKGVCFSRQERKGA